VQKHAQKPPSKICSVSRALKVTSLMLQIFVYVDGSDLEQVEALLLKSFADFSRSWGVESVRVINDKYERTPDLRPDDLPQWNLGLNFELERFPRTKVESLMQFLSNTARETGREFVVGTWNPKTMISEDLCFVAADIKQRDIDFLCEHLQ
jgi:hypothetical protein